MSKHMKCPNVLILGIFCFLFVIGATIVYFLNNEERKKFSDSKLSNLILSPEQLNTTINLTQLTNKQEAQTNLATNDYANANSYEPIDYAYVTLLHGIDGSFRYRGFLYNAIIMRSVLNKLGSQADFIVLLGFTSSMKNNNNSVLKKINDDIKLLERFQIKVYYLPRLLRNDVNTQKIASKKSKITFAEMALLKISPWKFTQYKRIQYLDGDILPIKNLDCFFKLNTTAFNTGNASPLNSGWYLAIPDYQAYQEMYEKATTRLTSAWDTKMGWGEVMPRGIFYRGNKKTVTEWDFNGASLDQGLFTHYFVINKGNVLLIDTKDAKLFTPGYQYTTLPLSVAIPVCDDKIPTNYFIHFTGQKKPWLNAETSRSKSNDVRLWYRHLNSLHLDVNSSNIYKYVLKSPLGYFYPNK